MKRIFSLVLVVCLLSTWLPSANAAFSDITDEHTALCANVLQSLGIASGTGNGNYSPNTVLTRAEFCTFAVRAMGLEDQVETSTYKTLFTDVKPGSWYIGYVNLAYDQGIVKGYGNGKFGPNDPINYAQVITVLLRMLGYTPKEIGAVWPTDDISYAAKIDLSDGVNASAQTNITRAQAAVLLYNMLKTEKNGTDIKYYNTIDGVSSVQKAIVLDVNADSEYTKNQLMVCAIGNTGATIEYYEQKNQVPFDLEGCMGDLLINAAGKVIGFVPESDQNEDIVIDSAKTAGIVDKNNVTHRITGSAVTIIGEEIYTWSTTGYIQADTHKGKTARVFYDDDGAARYVYLAMGTTGAGTDVIVAETNSAASELLRKFGKDSGTAITKNGVAVDENELGRYDVAYFNSVTNTLCVSDYRITGAIESANPSVDAAETITIGGCELAVLENAWSSLSKFRLGDRVTLLLTDDCKVAAAYAPNVISSDMIGVLSSDGRQVTLAKSGLVLSAKKMVASENLYGMLVKVGAAKNEIHCTAYSNSDGAGRISITNRTLGKYKISESCSIYEQAKSGSYKGYVYSLDGERGVASSDLDEIYWTDSVPSSNVISYHVNSAGLVDVILLQDVTGNCYDYGKITSYQGAEGIMIGTAAHKASTLTNGSGESAKYMTGLDSATGMYVGLALGQYDAQHSRIAAIAELSKTEKLAASSVFLNDGDWFATIRAYEIPISNKVEVYFESTDRWISGEEGVRTAVSSGMTMDVYYDRTLTTGAQVRIIIVRD